MIGKGGGPRTLGVLGTLVWDRIWDRDGRSEPIEEWGGIGYALGALSVSIPEGWRLLPILKLGRDLAEDGRRFVQSIPGVDDSGIIVVPEPNNRVELRYQDDARRMERLTGGVPPWTWPELAPVVELCDALYVNFISGFEMELDTAQALRVGYRGPDVRGSPLAFPPPDPAWRASASHAPGVGSVARVLRCGPDERGRIRAARCSGRPLGVRRRGAWPRAAAHHRDARAPRGRVRVIGRLRSRPEAMATGRTGRGVDRRAQRQDRAPRRPQNRRSDGLRRRLGCDGFRSIVGRRRPRDRDDPRELPGRAKRGSPGRARTIPTPDGATLTSGGG